MRRHLLLCSLLVLSASGCFDASAEVRNTEPGTAFTAAVLAAASAWSNGNEIDCGGAERAAAYPVYTTNASGANGRCEWTADLSHDAATWYPYVVCDNAIASQAAGTNLLDEWEAQCYRRVWTHDTPAGTSKTQQLGVYGLDLHGARYVRLSAREVDDTTNRGTFSAVLSCGMERR